MIFINDNNVVAIHIHFDRTHLSQLSQFAGGLESHKYSLAKFFVVSPQSITNNLKTT